MVLGPFSISETFSGQDIKQIKIRYCKLVPNFMESFIIAGIAPFFVENIPELQLAALKLVTGMYIPTDYTVQPGQDLVLLEL